MDFAACANDDGDELCNIADEYPICAANFYDCGYMWWSCILRLVLVQMVITYHG